MAIPFAPFLALGSIVALFAGKWILDAYLGLSRRLSGPSRRAPIPHSRYGTRAATHAEDSVRRRRAPRRRQAPALRSQARSRSTRWPSSSPTSSRRQGSCRLTSIAFVRGPRPDGLVRPGARRRGARHGREHRARRSPAAQPSARRHRRARRLAGGRRARSRCTSSSASCAIPYAIDGDKLLIAVADPQNVHAHRRASARDQATSSRSRSRPARTSRSRSGGSREPRRRSARARCSRTRRSFEEVEDDEDDLEADDGISDAPLVRLVNSLIFQAAEDGASDIHFEPQEDAIVVRFRIDGVLHEIQRIPKRMTAGVTTRLKVLAKLDIAERRKPQDGRISLNAARRRAECSTSASRRCRPSTARSVVDAAARQVEEGADARGARPVRRHARRARARSSARPTGALLVTGPTGSGKSTTLYAALSEINRPEINIITSRIRSSTGSPASTRCRSTSSAGLTFAAALRSILRSDPDVVMVGEIRDAETAKISIEAALTGHLVLSTLHTNDAPGAITRLNEMGVEPFLTGSAVTAVLAQRLARKLCSHCCEMYNPSSDELLEAASRRRSTAASDGMAFYRKKGCPRCSQTGYKGRIGIYQLLDDDRGDRVARGRRRRPARSSRRRRRSRACARCGTTASPRSSRASPRSKSSRRVTV